MPTDAFELARLNLEYVDAVARADASWFERHLASDFLNTNPDASLVDRAGFLARIARGPGVTQLRADDVRVRVMGDLAVIHARTTYNGLDGRAGAGRYTDVWQRRDGRWVVVAAHVARG